MRKDVRRARGGVLIDREQLQVAFRRIRRSCYQILPAPVFTGLVAWFISRDSAGSSGAAGSGTIALPLLVLMGVLALSPLLTVRLVRAAIRRSLGRPDPDMAQRRQMILPMESGIACNLWGTSTVVGFVAFFLGAPWWFLLASLAITYGGLFADFPRWSRWLEQAQRLDESAPDQLIPTPL